MTRGAILLISLAVAGAASAQGLSPHDIPSIKLGGLFLDLDTEVRTDSRTLKGSVIELEEDVGVTSKPVIPYAEIVMGQRFRVILGLLQTIRRGDDRLERSIKFNGDVIGVAGDTLETRSEFLAADLIFATALYADPGVRFEILLGGKYVHLHNRFSNRTKPSSAGVTRRHSADSVDAPTFFLGLGGHLQISRELTLYGRFLLTKYSANTFDVERFDYNDVSLGITYVFLPGISLSADYRLLRYDLAHDNSGFRSVYDLSGNGIGATLMIAY